MLYPWTEVKYYGKDYQETLHPWTNDQVQQLFAGAIIIKIMYSLLSNLRKKIKKKLRRVEEESKLYSPLM